MDVHIVNFVHGRRGWSSSLVLRNEDGAIAFGSAYWAELPAGEYVVNAVRAMEYAQVNAEMLWEGLTESNLEDIERDVVDVEPGWSNNPATDSMMLQRELEKAGWAD